MSGSAPWRSGTARWRSGNGQQMPLSWRGTRPRPRPLGHDLSRTSWPRAQIHDPTQEFPFYSERILSSTQRFLNCTQGILRSTQRILRSTQRFLGCTQRFLRCTQGILGSTQRILGSTQRFPGCTQGILGDVHWSWTGRIRIPDDSALVDILRCELSAGTHGHSAPLGPNDRWPPTRSSGCVADRMRILDDRSWARRRNRPTRQRSGLWRRCCHTHRGFAGRHGHRNADTGRRNSSGNGQPELPCSKRTTWLRHRGDPWRHLHDGL